MTELKTLKDIEFLSTNYANKRLRKESEAMNEMARDKVKQEAIKRAKEWKARKSEAEKIGDPQEYTFQEGRLKEIMEFVNITEEDLNAK